MKNDDGFVACVYGSTRTTQDFDPVVALEEIHIQELSDYFALPGYYADPFPMRNAIATAISINIIDPDTADKVDLIAVSKKWVLKGWGLHT